MHLGEMLRATIYLRMYELMVNLLSEPLSIWLWANEDNNRRFDMECKPRACLKRCGANGQRRLLNFST